MADLATLRLTWEPRMLSILRIMVGLLYMEHGLAKILDFPHQQTHVRYALFTLNPGLQGLLELVGGFLLAVGLFTRSVAFAPTFAPFYACAREETRESRGMPDLFLNTGWV